jgi:hypothetical protein
MTSTDRLLGDTQGRIAGIAMQVDAKLFEPQFEGRRSAYKAMFRSLTSETTLTVVADQSVVPAVQQWLDGAGLACRHQVVPVAGEQVTASSAWMRDALLVADRAGTRCYLKPKIVKQNGHQADWLAASDSTEVVDLQHLVSLEGGDCLVGPDFWLVGANAVQHTAELDGNGNDEATALARLKSLDPRPLLPVGYRLGDIPTRFLRLMHQFRRSLAPQSGTVQPPQRQMSRRRGRAASATAKAMRLNPDKLYQDWVHIDLVVSVTGRKNAGKNVLLVAELVPSERPGGAERALGAGLNALAKYLASCGFEVRRNPTRYISGELLGYNNVILQTSPDRVRMPSFAIDDGSRELDIRNKEIWQSLGFEVLLIDGWFAYTGTGGSLRCATNVIARTSDVQDSGLPSM